MNISQPVLTTVSSISFSFLTTEDVRRISVKQITNPTLLDNLNRPNIGGLYDPALGPSDKNDICATCRLTYFTCPGHFGHIELPAPVFHPLFMVNMYNLLRSACLFCHRFKTSRYDVCKFVAKLRLLEHGLLVAAQKLNDFMPEPSKQKSADGMDDDDPKAEGHGGSFEDFEKRVHEFVQINITRDSSSRRDNYKAGLVFQARKEAIVEFMKTSMVTNCKNCAARGYTFRKEGHTKIIEYDLSQKQKAIHSALNIKRPNVLESQRKKSTAAIINEERDPDIDMSDEESERGEQTWSGEDADDQERTLHQQNSELPISASGKVKTSRGRNERVMAPEECRAHLRRLYDNEAVMCSLLFGRHGPFAALSGDGFSFASADMFFLQVVPVAPTRFRPPAKMADTLFEHPQNELLAKILRTSYRLRDLNSDLNTASVKMAEYDDAARRTLLGSLLDALIQLQIDVNSFFDSSKNPQPTRGGKLPPAGVKQGLEKKEGLFRKHMMGKRVNYAARSVISPDVNIEPNEIGIPPVFAKRLTFPEPVTPSNLAKLRQAVINGVKEYPGATMVEYEDGRLQFLDKLSLDSRKSIANTLLTVSERTTGGQDGLFIPKHAINKKVYRHLEDGDMLILNRQPTLHKPSMMAHKARVLQGEKTIRLHYANCNSYNADFDGDEMNIHFPQNQVARAEAMYIANTENQYLVPTSGKPIRGLIQDHVVAGVWMTNRDTFFTREEYFQLLYGALRPEEDSAHHSGRLVTLPPTILKPRLLWTGKQIISTILKNITPPDAEGINLNSKSKVPGILWGVGSQEDKVMFVDGELLCGVLDKSAIGATDYGLVHSVYELYGADNAGRLLGILSRLFTKFLQHRAFTCRVDDLALTEEGNSRRRGLLNQGANLGTEAAIENFPSLISTPEKDRQAALVSLLEDVLRDDSKMAGLDMTVKGKLAKLTKAIADACMPHGLLRQFPHNHMQTMTQSGAKGSAVNVQQISCALGQQELEGRRVPVMVSGKTLPSFKPFETKAIAGGYVASRFLTGVKPQEFFFHCMAGREGLIDTAVKTSRSGYLQRCLIKHLEGIRVHYDNTVRGSDSSVYQFHYGGDALDVTKQKHLYEFEFIAQNRISFASRYQPKQAAASGFIDDHSAMEYMKMVIKKSAKAKGLPRVSKRDQFSPALDIYDPSRYLGATSEKFAERVSEYVKSNPHGLLKSKKGDEDVPRPKQRQDLMGVKHFNLIMNVKYMRSLVEPGEAVGLLASQGVGEPSTQMTLNTFHFAGHGAANVTLGIPRLREIVMTASTKPKTPSMTMYVSEGVSAADIEKFCKKASRLTLSQVVDTVVVKERFAISGANRSKEFTINISFFPQEEYRSEYEVDTREILMAFATQFPQRLRKEIQFELKKLEADMKTQIAALGKGKAGSNEAGRGDDDEGGEDETTVPRGDDASEVGDGDAEDAKRARQKQEQATYESDDDYLDDEAIEDRFQGDDSDDDDDDAPVAPEDAQPKPGALLESLFLQNCPPARMFKFSPQGCKIKLSFGSDMPKLLLVGVVEKTCLNTVVREISGITDCFQSRVEGNDDRISLSTNGSNFRGLWDFNRGTEPIINTNDIYSNNIYEILCTYGVEAARTAIIREMSSVFDVYKIDVNIRHLELIADYMTFEGGYKPFNRKGISTNPSPLLKASFETTAAFLSDAALHGDYDDLTTPSGNIVVGRVNHTGTGAFDIVVPVEPDVAGS